MAKKNKANQSGKQAVAKMLAATMAVSSIVAAVPVVATAAAATPAGPLTGASLTDNTGMNTDGQVIVNLPATVAGTTYGFQVFDSGNVPVAPDLGSDGSTYTPVVDGDIIDAANGKIVRIVEIDSTTSPTQVKSYVDLPSIAVSETLPATVHQGTVANSTYITSTVTDAAYRLVVKVGTSEESPDVGALVTGPGVTDPYTSEKDISGVDDTTNKYVAIYEVDSDNKIVRYHLFTLGISDIRQASTAPAANDIVVTNNAAGTDDTIVVKGLASGDVVKVYNASVGGNELGSATAAETVVSGVYNATVSVAQLGTVSGSVYVTVTNAGKAESARTEQLYNAEATAPTPTASTAPSANNISVTNNAAGTDDTIVVTGFASGDVVKVYSASTGGSELGSATAVDAGGLFKATVSVPQLGTVSGSVYVTVTSGGLTESTPRTEKAYNAEPQGTSSAPAVAQMEVKNNVGTPDTVMVSGLLAGDEVKVYAALTGGAPLGSAVASANAAGTGYYATVSINQIGTVSGSVYVTVTSTGKAESTPRTELPYDAEVYEQTPAPSKNDITVVNNSVGDDSVIVKNVPAGATVRVYSTTGGIGKEVQGNTAGTLTVTIPAGALDGVNEVFVTVEDAAAHKTESAEVAQTVPAVTRSNAPAASDITVTNNPTGGDSVVVKNVPTGAKVRVYVGATSTMIIGSEVQSGTSSTVSVPIANGFDVNLTDIYVSIEEGPVKSESERTHMTVPAAPVYEIGTPTVTRTGLSVTVTSKITPLQAATAPATVIFQLMDGDQAIQLVAIKSNINNQEVSAQYNLPTDKAYTVQVLIWDDLTKQVSKAAPQTAPIN